MYHNFANLFSKLSESTLQVNKSVSVEKYRFKNIN